MNAVLIAVPDGGSSLDVLVVRHRTAWDNAMRGRQKANEGKQEWVEATLELAVVLADERKLFPADREFSRWLERNKLAAISHQDRAALIGFAQDLVVTRAVLEKTHRISWQEIWRHERPPQFTGSRKPHQTPAKRKSKTERQLIDKVLNLHCTRGFSYDETAAELGLTRNQIAGIVFRNGNINNKPTPPPPKRWEGPGLDSKSLTRQQVDPDFKGDAVQFATKYGHVLLHTKAEIEENKRQEVLRVWLAAVTNHQQSARALAGVEAPNPDTLRQWLAKPGKADKMRAWVTAIEAAYRIVAPCLEDA